MQFKTLATLFNRSVAHAFDIRKFLSLFLILLLAGIIFLFFNGLALYATRWLKLLLRSISFFATVALLLGIGTFLIRLYLQEKEKREDPRLTSFFSSWSQILKASYFVLPLFLLFLAFWIMLGIFILLKFTPFLGRFLGIVLAFAPFTLNLGILLLFVAALILLFFLTPVLALKNTIDQKALLSRLRFDLFTHIVLFVVAFLPVWVFWSIAAKAMALTFEVYSFGDRPLIMLFQGLFILIPLTAFLTLPLIFFFNFALEAYELVEENISPKENVSHHP